MHLESDYSPGKRTLQSFKTTRLFESFCSFSHVVAFLWVALSNLREVACGGRKSASQCHDCVSEVVEALLRQHHREQVCCSQPLYHHTVLVRDTASIVLWSFPFLFIFPHLALHGLKVQIPCWCDGISAQNLLIAIFTRAECDWIYTVWQCCFWGNFAEKIIAFAETRRKGLQFRG